MAALIYDVFNTPFGWAASLVSSIGIRALTIQSSPQEAVRRLGRGLHGAMQDPEAVLSIRRAIEDYSNGKCHSLQDIVLDVGGAPPFFSVAWEACRAIPIGETRSYGWLAAAAGRPLAFRAAGQAMAHNPVALVIPCHRVVASDGSLGGYGMGGLTVKARLLELETRARMELHSSHY